MSTWLGTAWGLGSAISWACANASIQVASRRVGSWSALVWAQVFGGLLALGVAISLEGWPTLAAVEAGWMSIVGAGLAAAVAYGGLFQSLNLGQVAIVSPIISAWSVGSVVIVALRGQVPTGIVALGVAMVVTGNVLVARSSGAKSDRGPLPETPAAAIAWAALAACGFAVMVPLLDSAGRSVGRLWTVPLVWLVELVVLVPVLARMQLLELPKTSGDVLAVCRAAVFEVAGFICISTALGLAPVSIVSPISSLSTMGSVALGVVLLRERVARVALAGAILASVGVVVVNL